MLIHEICAQCGVTKKAVEYYEKQGLLKPALDGSNYRNYDVDDAARLREIVLLRQLGIGLADIKVFFASPDRRQALADLRRQKRLAVREAEAQYDCLGYLMEHADDLEGAAAVIAERLDANTTIKDKLLQAFPGNYGLFLTLHFGHFLTGKLATAEQRAAYCRIIEFLDGVAALEFPAELEQFLNEGLAGCGPDELTELDVGLHTVLADAEAYIAAHREELGQYLKYRASPEFGRSPAGRLRQLLLEFHRTSGYYDVFIPSLTVLSPSYREYRDKFAAANAVFLQAFPAASDILGTTGNSD